MTTVEAGASVPANCRPAAADENGLRYQTTWGQYGFSLRVAYVPSERDNRRGRSIGYCELAQDDATAIQMWFLPYAATIFAYTHCWTDCADMTVQLNRCSFGDAQSVSSSDCHITNHNTVRDGNDPTLIEGDTNP